MSTNVLESLSLKLIGYEKGQKLPTILELTKVFDVGTGTIQKNLKVLTDSKAIRVEARGHRGSFIEHIDYFRLCYFANINHFTIDVPSLEKFNLNPSMKRFKELLQKNAITLSLNEVAGSEVRRNNLKLTSDAIYLSRLASEIYSNNEDVVTFIFHEGSYYLHNNIMLVSRNELPEITTKIKVGIDRASKDHEFITEAFFKKYNVEYINSNYATLPRCVFLNDIEFGIWDRRESIIPLDKVDIKCKPIELPEECRHVTSAAIVVKRDNPLSYLLERYLD
ncbi:YhfZ family protein [Vibrio mediterranei]|uniref:YhfZ family protein n=1 Tax=Vibrio mediterranei TaxID=689 RepID=UPI00148E3AA7|nr:YhfZ family protein [Vibrio mediterranei]NOI23812.1 hypothetical protein [Vibrio mediterranei]